MDSIAILSIVCSMGIFATTIHTQDFKDTAGDAAVGRQTLPIISPKVSRFTVPVVLIIWSIGLRLVWQLGRYTATAFILLAAVTSARFFFLRSISDDKISFYYWYNVSIRHIWGGGMILSTIVSRSGCRSPMLCPGTIDITIAENRGMAVLIVL